MDSDGDISDAGTLNQSTFSYPKSYNPPKGRNAQQVYQEMEWEQ